MPDHWEFKSHTYDNCNCAVNCGCQFNLPSTHGHCQTAYVGTIAVGSFNDTPLAGLNWAGLYMWPGEIAEGNGKRQIVIDEGADEAQRIALETIISGKACAPLSNHFSVFGSLCSEFCETLFLPIDLEANFELRTARACKRNVERLTIELVEYRSAATLHDARYVDPCAPPACRTHPRLRTLGCPLAFRRRPRRTPTRRPACPRLYPWPAPDSCTPPSR